MEERVTITVTGDVFMPGTVRWSNGSTAECDMQEAVHIMDKVAPYFQKSDINFCNLEAPISELGVPAPGRATAFCSYPGMELLLKKSNITFVSLANNHSQDYGWRALEDTIRRLDEAGIGHAGAGYNLFEAQKPAVAEANGLKTGMLAFTANVNTPMGFKASANREGLNAMRISPYFHPDDVNTDDLQLLTNAVSQLRKETDFVIVSCHWGISEGGTHIVCRHQEAIAHAAIDAGADLVAGHHPHALQPVEIYKGKPICYSLGNYIFSLEEDMPKESMMFQCVFSKQGIQELKFLPCCTNEDNQPQVYSPADSETGENVVRLMERLCAKYGTKLSINAETGEVYCGSFG